MHSSGSFLRQLSRKEGNMNNANGVDDHNGLMVLRKRVMVVVNKSSDSKHVMMWTLTHVANKADLITLLHIISPTQKSCKSSSSSHYFVNSLVSLCKAFNPQVEVEAVVIRGTKLETVMNQVKKLEISVLVLGQKCPSLLLNCLSGMNSSSEEFVEQCINNADCLTIGVRKQSKGLGGYLITTRWQKNFWLLA